jgi:perosamine synthetase
MLSGLPVQVHQEAADTTHSYWMVTILVEDSRDRDALRIHLDEDGIETRPLFYPVHTMPMYSATYQKHPNAENLGWRGINLPSYPALAYEDVKNITNSIKAYFNKKGSSRNRVGGG